MNYVYESDAEVLSYRAFQDREALRAWQERRREHYRRRGASSSYSTVQERLMDRDRVSGNWHQLKGKVKEQWGKLTDDDLTQLEGHSERLAGKIQEHYGLAREDAERQAKEFCSRNNWH